MNAHLALMLVVSLAAVAVTTLAADPPRECPSAADEDPQHPVHLPHPTDCHKFYKCYKGEKYEHDCPSNHHWNIEKDYCDWPEEANCVRPLP